jgi:hypothetical protein
MNSSSLAMRKRGKRWATSRANAQCVVTLRPSSKPLGAMP